MYWKYDFDLEKLNVAVTQPHLVDAFEHNISDEYFQGWQSAFQYCYNVLTGKRIASQSEIAMCERFVYDLTRDDLVFKHKEVDLAITIINMLCHPKGHLAGTRMDLMRWMIFVIANQFGWYYSDKAHKNLRGARRYQQSAVFVPRGNAKTTLAAGITVVNTLLTVNGSPVSTCSATTSKQAGIAYKDIARMIKSSPSIRKHFNVLAHEIRCTINDGTVMATSKQADSLNGFRISTAILDEWAAHPNAEVTDAIMSGSQSSIDPIIFCISTAYNNFGYGYEVFNYVRDIAMNVIENDRLFSAIYSADDSDIESNNFGIEEVFIKANPSYGHSVIPASLESAYVASKRSESAKANFLIKHLNVFYQFSNDNLLSSDELQAGRLIADLDDSKYCNKPCYVGIDLAGVSDLSSVALIFPQDDGSVETFHKAYLPQSVLDECSPALAERYMNAVKANELTLTYSEITDFEYIKDDLNSFVERFQVEAISIDQAAGGARFAMEYNENAEVPIVAVKQGFGLSEATVLLKGLVKESKFKYVGNLLEWGLLNSLEREGNSGDIMIAKSVIDKQAKIDPAIATVIGLSRTILQETNSSIYEHQDVRFL
ncbi:terminase large subunit [Photobacterium swingsii]|uniref:terminase large subunit n=1 Tax=Photobacterium swingsii TaxID=680026 RepID=UPI003D1116DE